jgi:hypothetical protein
MRSRLDRNSTLRQAAWCALPALALLSIATVPAAAGGPGAHGATGNSHHINPAFSSARPLALSAGLSTPVPVLRVAETKSFGYLQTSRLTSPSFFHKSAAAPPQGGSHGQDAHATGEAIPRIAASDTQVILDNTLVTADLEPSNGVYAITPNFGKQAGGNLFFSFSSFSLTQSQTASFQPGATPPGTGELGTSIFQFNSSIMR